MVIFHRFLYVYQRVYPYNMNISNIWNIIGILPIWNTNPILWGYSQPLYRTYHLIATFTVCGKIHHAMKFGKPSNFLWAMASMAMLNNQRVYMIGTSNLDSWNGHWRMVAISIKYWLYIYIIIWLYIQLELDLHFQAFILSTDDKIKGN